MKTLITGGLGYLGGRIADFLRTTSVRSEIVLASSRSKRAVPAWARGYPTVPFDLRSPKSIERALKKVRPKTIIHLAAMNEVDSLKDVHRALTVNTLGTYHLLARAAAARIERFVYFSTYHVYGAPAGLPITEQTPTRPFHPYAITHRAAEDFVTYFRHYHGMKTLIFRLSNGFGYPMDTRVDRWTLVFNDLCKQAVLSGKAVLKTTGTQHRDFISLHDIARAVHHFLYVIPDRWDDGLFNLGGNRSMSIRDAAATVARVYRSVYARELPVITGKRDDRNPAPVRYSIDKLLSTGFRLEGNMENEIIGTLKTCEDMDHGRR